MRTTIRSWTAVLAAAVVSLTVTGAAAGESAAPVPSVGWQECGPNLDCATLDVPVVHTDPGGATVALALIRHRATDPDRRIGSLLINPGGPGGPATDVIRTIDAAAGTGPYSPELLARYDIVGMDPRGVGGSEAIRCLSDAEREPDPTLDIDPTLLGGQPRDEVDAGARKISEGCAVNADQGLLANMATDDVARDMDLVRAALGEEQVSYLGQSYGTFLGATYATLFPDRVRHMVLDASVDPVTWERDPLDAFAEQTVSGEQNLDLWFETCRAQACPFGDGDPEAAFDALITGLEAAPLEVPAGPVVTAGRLDGATALSAARVAIITAQGWPVLTAGLVNAQNGDGTLLLALAQAGARDPDGTPSGFVEALLSVKCLDGDFPTDVAAYEQTAEEIAADAPRFGPVSAFGLLSCATWPAQNPDRFTGPLTAAGAPPILVIGGEVDSQTPYRWSENMAESLESGVLLTREGPGHVSYRASGPCVDTAVDRYLIDGATPDNGTVCAQEPPATTIP